MGALWLCWMSILALSPNKWALHALDVMTRERDLFARCREVPWLAR